MPSWLRLVRVLLVAGLVFASVALLARLVVHGPVDRVSLATSLTRASGSGGTMVGKHGSCRPWGTPVRLSHRRPPKGTVLWTCTVPDRAVSSVVRYRVRVRRGSSCWDALVVVQSTDTSLPRNVSGCVHLWQWTALTF